MVFLQKSCMTALQTISTDYKNLRYCNQIRTYSTEDILSLSAVLFFKYYLGLFGYFWNCGVTNKSAGLIRVLFLISL